MAVMNRLAPLIARRSPSPFPARSYAPAQAPVAAAEAAPAGSSDLKLFATNFLGGLAFFGTYLA